MDFSYCGREMCGNENIFNRNEQDLLKYWGFLATLLNLLGSINLQG
jgi:hypothetical protein